MDEVTLTVAVDGDEHERADLLNAIGQVLADLDHVRVETVRETPPAGAKSAAGLAVEVTATMMSAVLPVAMTAIIDRYRRRQGSCRLMFDLGGGVQAEVSDLDDLEPTMQRLAELGFPIERPG